jgi:predicted ferric reductase
VWVALGQVGFYLTILVTFTFYIRRQIGNRVWHLIHFLSYAAFAMALLHGVGSGTDSSNLWISWMYWLGGLSMLGLTVHRMMVKQHSLSPARQARQS